MREMAVLNWTLMYKDLMSQGKGSTYTGPLSQVSLCF